jgi:hypothetical protein
MCLITFEMSYEVIGVQTDELQVDLDSSRLYKIDEYHPTHSPVGATSALNATRSDYRLSRVGKPAHRVDFDKTTS